MSEAPLKVVEPHPESPLRLSLVRQMLTDPTVRLHARAVDVRWRDAKIVLPSVGGFNPFVGAVFCSRHSPLDEWLRDPAQSARPFNREDRLMKPLLFAVHDYFHVWATRLIQRLAPEIGFGTRPITRGSFDDQVFCMLLSEAAATVGTDYWWLCSLELNQVVPIGTRINEGITCSYHERDAVEYRRFQPELDVQSPGFFGEMCEFYCTGEFVGFGAEDILHSPQLWSWLTKEIKYGDRQREIARGWLRQLAVDEIALAPDDLIAPVDLEAPGRRALIEQVGEAVWRKVKHDELSAIPPSGAEPWRSPSERAPDFRFCNANTFADEQLFAPAPYSTEQYEYLFWQVVSRCDFGVFDRELMKLLPTLLDKRDPRLLGAMLRNQPRLDGAENEPRDLLVLN